MAVSSKFSKEELSKLKGTEASISGTPEIRFLQASLDYFGQWLSAHAQRLKAAVVPHAQAMVMLYAQAPLISLGLHPDLVEHEHHVNRHLCAQENGLVVCNENLNTMVEVVPAFDNSQQAMNFCTQHLHADQVFVILLLTQRKALVHHAGADLTEWIDNPQIVELPENSPLEITPAMIEKRMQVFYDTGLRTHRGIAARHMWLLDSEFAKLDTQPELRVQSFLLVHLRASYHDRARVLVDEEIRNSGGRVDIRVARHHPASGDEVETMIELKVLPPTDSDSKNEKWAIKGITQANDYRTDFTDVCFACVYDARQIKSDMPKVQAAADQQKVTLKRYEMALPPVPSPRTSRKKPSADADADAKPVPKRGTKAGAATKKARSA